MLGIDETILYENVDGLTVDQGTILSLSESFHNFNYIKIIDHSFDISGSKKCTIIPVQEDTISIATNDAWFDIGWNPTANASKYIGVNFYSADSGGNSLMTNGSFITNMDSSGIWNNRNAGNLYKVIGIGRKEA